MDREDIRDLVEGIIGFGCLPIIMLMLTVIF